ncbi:hypothetical protein V7068_22270 [Bacillus sp. JJ634]
MKEFYSKIGDHIIKITHPTDSLINLFKNHFATKETKPDLSITIQEGYGNPFSNYEVKIEKTVDKINFQRTDYMIEVDSEYKEAIVSVYDDLALKHALMNLYSSFIIYHNWGLLIHSSCVIEKDTAHIFAGQSGAGKSTAAKLSYPRDLLSDEATILKITPGEIIVCNSPFRSELESSKYLKGHPLGSIQLLYQSLQSQRISVKKSDALIELMNKVFYWETSAEETRNILGLLRTVVDTVPTFKLYFQKNNTFWELIS